MKFLILKPSSLGDVVQALPVLRLLKRHRPRSEVYWWIDARLAPLLEGDPDLAGLIRFDRRRWAAPRNWLRFWKALQWTRQQEFDWVIDLQCLARSAVFGWLANGKRLVGLDEPRDGARGFYDVAVRRASWHTHAVDWYLGVLPVLGVPPARNFDWLPARRDVADSLRRRWPVGDARWVAVQPGGRWANKRWPVEKFAEAVRQLAAGAPGLRFALLGSQEESALSRTIAQAAAGACLDLCGQLTLPEMVEWIRLSRLILTNDTGPMHVAAALGIPVVGLFGPTEPRRTGPYGQLENTLQLNLPCVPCMSPRCTHAPALECLRALPVQAVVEAARRHLNRG